MLYAGYAVENGAVPTYDDVNEVRARLVDALERYCSTNSLSKTQLAERLGVARTTLYHWLKRTRHIPASKIENIIHDLRLDRAKIVGDDKSPNGVHFIGSVNYTARYNGAMTLNKPYEAKRYMREAGFHIFDLLKAHNHKVDYVVTNREKATSESVQILTHIGVITYVFELCPSQMLTYRFTKLEAGEPTILHDGAFSLVILKVVVTYLNKELNRKSLTKERQKTEINDLIAGARQLSTFDI